MTVIEEQSISVPISVSDSVTLLEDVGIDDEGSERRVVFEDRVAMYNPSTNKLVFENSDIGYAEFVDKLREAEGIEILR